MIRTLTLAALAVALAAPSTFAQQQQKQQQQRDSQQQRQSDRESANAAPVSDQLFAQAAAIGGVSEVAVAQIGVQKATDPELKKFSQQMVADHTRMNSELTQLASSRQIPLPTAVDPKSQFCAQSLAGLSGEKFDRCYAKAQLIIHMDSVAMFEAEAERGQDPAVKALAAKSLPHIKHHLATIKPIAMRYEQEHPSTEGAAPAPKSATDRGAASGKSDQ